MSAGSSERVPGTKEDGLPVVMAPVREGGPAVSGTWLARVGLALRRHDRAVQKLQWGMTVCYAALVAVPALLPLPGADTPLCDDFTRYARFILWGIWWPLVILSVMALGRSWCGLFCPEGALSEWVSAHGAGRGIPRWMKWGGWPFVTFLGTTVFGQLTRIYRYPEPTFLILGGSTAAAMAVGLAYGRGKRVWCRHLCPVSGVFALLAKVAPVHFRTDCDAWDSAPAGHRTSRAHAVNCAPLISIRRLESASACHMCGRCAGERGAVALRGRPPASEIFRLRPGDTLPGARETGRWPARLLVFGMLGVALGAFQWSVSPWFADATRGVAGWLTTQGVMWPLQDPGHWWLLANYPRTGDVFSWLDGAMVIAYIGAEALVIGGWVVAWMRLAEAATGIVRERFVEVLIPFAGVSVFVGLSFLTTSGLAGDRIPLPWADAMRMLLLAAAAIWSAVLALRLAPRGRGVAAAATLIAAALPLAAWTVQCYLW